jgi:sugar phosphate permease
LGWKTQLHHRLRRRHPIYSALCVRYALPVFTLAWIGNRLLQSIGWAGLIKVCSKWFGFSPYDTVIGILSLSY